jgi:hypothetical protein
LLVNRDPVRDTDIEAWLDDEPDVPATRLRLRLRAIVIALALALAAFSALGWWVRS